MGPLPTNLVLASLIFANNNYVTIWELGAFFFRHTGGQERSRPFQVAGLRRRLGHSNLLGYCSKLDTDNFYVTEVLLLCSTDVCIYVTRYLPKKKVFDAKVVINQFLHYWSAARANVSAQMYPHCAYIVSSAKLSVWCMYFHTCSIENMIHNGKQAAIYISALWGIYSPPLYMQASMHEQ